MNSFTKRLRRIFRDTRGTYLIEFAMISLPLSTILMGGMELGYLSYSKSHVEGALREVSRLAATGTATEEELDALLNTKIDDIAGATAVIEKKSYASFRDVDQPEPLVSDVAPLGGEPGSGDCYLDVNANGSWDSDMGSGGLGGSEDIIYYGVTVTYPVLFSLSAPILNGGHDSMTIEANAVIKNEPFGEASEPEAARECIA
jgi:hypothetical protein